MVKGVRRCSARRARRICGLNPHRRQNIYMDYVSAVVKQTCVAVETERNIIIHRRGFLECFDIFFINRFIFRISRHLTSNRSLTKLRQHK